jgi:hypothetical protein
MLFSCRKQLHDRIYSLRGEIWAYATSLTPPRFVEAPDQTSTEHSHVFMFYVFRYLHLSTIFLLDFGTVRQ